MVGRLTASSVKLEPTIIYIANKDKSIEIPSLDRNNNNHWLDLQISYLIW